MSAVEKLSSYIPQCVYTVPGPFHPFGGAVDIIVVQQPDRSFKSSPWYVRFGKFQGVLKTREKVVTIAVNGVEARFHMYLDYKGKAYFLKDADDEDGGTVVLSPPSSSEDETDEKNSGGPRITKTQSYNMDGDGGQLKVPDVEVDTGDGAIVRRTGSRRSGLFGLMFGGRSMKESGEGTANVDGASSIERAEIAADLLDTKWSTNLPANDSPRAHSVDGIAAGTKSSSHGEGVDDRFAMSASTKEHSEKVDVHSSPSSSHQTIPGIDESNAINARESSNLNSVDDSLSPSLRSDVAFEERIGSHREQLGDDFRTNLISQLHFEERVTHTPGKRTHEEVIEIAALEAGDLAERTGVNFESVMTESGNLRFH